MNIWKEVHNIGYNPVQIHGKVLEYSSKVINSMYAPQKPTDCLNILIELKLSETKGS